MARSARADHSRAGHSVNGRLPCASPFSQIIDAESVSGAVAQFGHRAFIIFIRITRKGIVLESRAFRNARLPRLPMEKKELTPEELEELKNRHIRSFVLRRGHISNAQKRALEEELPQYAVEYSASPAAAWAKPQQPLRPHIRK